MTGVFSAPLNLLMRALFMVAAVLFVSSDWITDVAGAGLMALLIAVTRRKAQHTTENQETGEQT